VADRFEVDLEHAPLIELALGSKAGLILIDELGPLVDYLKHTKSPISGRVGFRPIPDSQTKKENRRFSRMNRVSSTVPTDSSTKPPPTMR
jgi:hypothetical protein